MVLPVVPPLPRTLPSLQTGGSIQEGTGASQSRQHPIPTVSRAGMPEGGVPHGAHNLLLHTPRKMCSRCPLAGTSNFRPANIPSPAPPPPSRQ